jgi:hypothetical protein
VMTTTTIMIMIMIMIMVGMARHMTMLTTRVIPATRMLTATPM